MQVWLGDGPGVMGDGTCSFLHASSGEGIVALYATPNPFLLNKLWLNQLQDIQICTILFNVSILLVRFAN